LNFIEIWLPSIVCTFGGILVAWLMGWRQGRAAAAAADQRTLMLTNLLLSLEEKGLIELVRDQSGNIAGGRNFKLEAQATAVNVEGFAATAEDRELRT
jgi:hypothetical protein